MDKMDNQSAPILEETYNMFKQGLKNWIEQDLKWKREEIVSCRFENEILDDGYVIAEDGQKWAQKKLGKHVNVTLKSSMHEAQSQKFIRLDTGDWQKKGE